MTKKQDNLLEYFYEYPTKHFTVRDLAKRTHLPKSTVHVGLVALRKEGLISSDNSAILNDVYKIKKIHFFIEKLFMSGCISFLEKKLSPSCIILFGSIRKGESEKESDIDLFVETTQKTEAFSLDLFEKKIGHPIQLFKYEKITDLPDRLFNNVVNGIKLKGFFTIKK